MVFLVGVEARFRPLFNCILVVYLHLAFIADHQAFLFLLVADHVFSEELGQLVFCTLEPRHAFFFELLLDFEVRLHVIFFRLEGDIGLNDVNEAIDVLTLLDQHVDRLRKDCLAL